MTGAAADVLDVGDSDFLADPYSRLAELRTQGPVLWDEREGRWLATSHQAVTDVLRERGLGRIWRDHEPADEMSTFNALHRHQMMENEPPAHTRLRRLVAGAFGRGHVERIRPRIERLATEMVSELDDTFDALADFAEPMPVFVIADLLGVPRRDHHDLRRWSQAMVAMYEPSVDGGARAEAEAAANAFSRYVHDLLRYRRQHPSDDLICDLMSESDGEAKLTDDELVASVVLLLNAGHEASVNAFGNGLYALLCHPEQCQRVTNGQVSVATALEELLRFDTPLQMFERTATTTVDIAGQRIEPGQKVATLMGSANRDPDVFVDPDRLNVGRQPNPHVGFGMGLHFCLGAPLARTELQSSLRALFNRFDTLQVVGVPQRRPTWVLRGFKSLEVTT